MLLLGRISLDMFDWCNTENKGHNGKTRVWGLMLIKLLVFSI